MRSDAAAKNWTRDADGQFVDWTKPPHYDEQTGILCLVLPGEDPNSTQFQMDHHKRCNEFTLLRRRQMSVAAEERRQAGLAARRALLDSLG